MIAFWIVAALLLTGAVLFLVPPLLRAAAVGGVAHDSANLAVLRDQLRELDADLEAGALSDTQYAAARAELEQRAVEESAETQPTVLAARSSRAALAALVLAVPAIAVPLYLYLGTPEGLDPQAAQFAGNQSHEVTREQIETMVERLAERLAADPDDNEGWVMLARSYNALGRYAEAAQAFKTLSERLPEDAQLLADYADTLAMAQGRSLRGEPERLITRALEVDGSNLKALALAGTIAFEREDYAAAVGHWERLVALVPDSKTAASMQNSIAEARRRLGEGAPPAVAAAAAVAVSGRVALAPALAGRVSPTDTVFVFARAASGPKMPLAIVRKQVKDLPFEFTLDDSTAMNPALRLSRQQSVVVGARISKSGDAKASPGDLEGYTATVPVGSRDLAVTIAQEVR